MNRRNRGRSLRRWGYGIVSPLLILLICFPYQGCSVHGEARNADVPSLDVKIGQMLLVGFRGLAVDDGHPIVRDIRERHLGGVILFDYDVPTCSSVRNIESPEQVRALVSSLRSHAALPLLVAVDQEGGRVCRLKEKFGFSPTVSARFLGGLNESSETYRNAAAVAKDLADAGIDLNLAPVVDLNVNPDNPVIGKLERSFSADPGIVAANARVFIRAHHDYGVLCTLKHFPGHGSSTGDTHLGMVNVTDTWIPAELEPYRILIEEKMADAVMTAHVFNARLDPKYPATLSRPTVTGLLRENLGFDGPVLSDDLQMKALSENFGFETAVEKAIEADVDILVIANNSVFDENAAARSIAVIRKLVREGKISEDRIDRSFRRILKLKKRMGHTFR